VGDADRDWRSTLFPNCSASDWLDVAVVAGTSVAEMIEELHSGARGGKIPPPVVEAFHLQFPSVGDFREFIQAHDSPEQLRGIFSGLKGKLFELYHVEYLNDGHLPDGYIAELASSATQPGYDIMIEDAHHHPADYLQDKATESLAIVREAIGRYPEFDVYVPHGGTEVIHDPELLGHVFETPIHREVLNHEVDAGIEAAGHTIEYHFPWLGEIIIVGTELNHLRQGKSSLQRFRERVWRRGSRLFGTNLIGQLLAIGTHTPEMQAVAIPTRLMIARWDVSRDFERRTEQRRARIRQLADAFASRDVMAVRLLTVPLLLFGRVPTNAS
jgi:hypothetical protein